MLRHSTEKRQYTVLMRVVLRIKPRYKYLGKTFNFHDFEEKQESKMRQYHEK